MKTIRCQRLCVTVTHGCSDQQVRPSVIALSRQAWQGESPNAISEEQMSSRELTQSAQVNSNANGSLFEQVILGWNHLSFGLLSPVATGSDIGLF